MRPGEAAAHRGRCLTVRARPRGLYIAFAGLNGCLYVQHLQSSAGGVEAEQQVLQLQPTATELVVGAQMSLIAHGGPVNMIKVHQQDQNLIFSASKVPMAVAVVCRVFL